MIHSRTSFQVLRGPAAARRGSVFILVVAILAVLALLTLVISYSTKIELMAARNWSNGVQARVAAVTGVPLFDAQPVGSGAALVAPLSSAQADIVRPLTMGSGSGGGLQPVVLRPRLAEVSVAATPTPAPVRAGSAGIASTNAVAKVPAFPASTTQQNSPAAAIAEMPILEDESGKININAILPWPTAPADSRKLAAMASAGSGSGVVSNTSTVTALPNLAANSGATQASNSAVPSIQNWPAVAMMHEDTLANFINATLQARGVSGVDGTALAHSIALRRLGADHLPSALPTPTPNAQRLKMMNATQLARQTAQTAQSAAAAQNIRTLQVDENGRPLADLWQSGADVRVTPQGDDRPFASLDALMSVPGMTPQAYAALSPYLTVFSVGFAAYETPDGAVNMNSNVGVAARLNAKNSSRPATATTAAPAQTVGWPQIDPNTADPELIFETLKKRFPAMPEALLGQFTANVVDRRDSDGKSSHLRLGGGEYDGFERSVYINEVCSDSSSFGDPGDGDDGQFVEFYNPFSTALSVNGWMLDYGNGSLPLAGSVAPDGYLVVCRDFNNEHDTQPHDEAGQGSFYNIYHKVGADARHRLEAMPQLNLPQASGTIKLLNEKGEVVDQFDYKGGTWIGANSTFQRRDPRLRHASMQKATPLAPNEGQDDAELKLSIKMMERFQDQPFGTALDLMTVSSSFAVSDAPTGSILPTTNNQSDAQSGATTSVANASAAPHALPQLTADTADGLDVRLVDCFHIGIVIPDAVVPGLSNSAAQAATVAAPKTPATGVRSASGLQADPAALASLNVARSAANAPTCGKVFGRLNLNTAALATLSALPGMTPALLQGIYRGRHADIYGGTGAAGVAGVAAKTPTLTPQLPEWWTSINPLAEPRWKNLSDFVLDESVWQGRPLYDRLDAVYPFAELVATESMVLRAVTVTRVPQVAGADGKGVDSTQQNSRVISERIMAGDRGAMETILFRLVSQNSGLYDPDLRYSKPESQMGNQMGILNLLRDPVPHAPLKMSAANTPKTTNGAANGTPTPTPLPVSAASKRSR